MSDDRDFFSNNICYVNKIVQVILTSCLLVPIVFIVGSFFRIWSISYKYSICLLVMIFAFVVIDYFLNTVPKLKRVAMYFGLISGCVIVFALFMNRLVNPTIVLAIMPLISCLYYNIKLTIVINVINLPLLFFASYARFGKIWDGYLVGMMLEVGFLIIATYYLLRNTFKSQACILKLSREQEELNTKLTESNLRLKQSQYKIIQFVSFALGRYDSKTALHVNRVQKFVELIVKELQEDFSNRYRMSQTEMNIIIEASFLHDIGKVKIDKSIIQKSNRNLDEMSGEENTQLRTHPEEGKKLLELLPEVDKGLFNKVAIDMAYCHHENFDGSGYPRGLKGKEIPLSARIVRIADYFDHEISKRECSSTAVIEVLKDINDKADIYFEKTLCDALFRIRDLLIDVVFMFNLVDETDEEM